MARDAVTLTAVPLNSSVAETVGTTISVANGASIDVGGDTTGVFVVVKNTNGSARVVTFAAGDNPPAATSGIGGVAVSVEATTGVRIVCLEGARVVQSDGLIHVDFAASFAGTIHAYRLPSSVAS